MNAVTIKYGVFAFDLDIRMTRVNLQQEYRVDVLVSPRINQIKLNPDSIGQAIVDCVDSRIEPRFKVRNFLEQNIKDLKSELIN